MNKESVKISMPLFIGGFMLVMILGTGGVLVSIVNAKDKNNINMAIEAVTSTPAVLGVSTSATMSTIAPTTTTIAPTTPSATTTNTNVLTKITTAVPTTTVAPTTKAPTPVITQMPTTIAPTRISGGS